MSIRFYSKGEAQYQFLSNFFRAPFAYDRKWWPTAEHLYQAMKYESDAVRDTIRQLATPQEAKAYAERHPDGKCQDWYNQRKQVMEFVLTLKFYQNPELANELISLEEDLVHYCPWGDDYWGVDRTGQGKNVLGELLMALRDTMRSWQS